MEQITAKEQAIINKWAYHMRESAISEEDAIKEAFLELRSVSETKPDEDSFQQYLLELGIGAKERDLIITKYGVPVSETKEPDGWVISNDLVNNAFYSAKNKDDVDFIKNHCKHPDLTPVYFSPVPVSEVGQMEEKKKAKFRVGKKQHRAILEIGTGKEYLVFPVGSEKACREYCKYLNGLPVPNTKTVEGEATAENIIDTYLKGRSGISYKSPVINYEDAVECVKIALSSLRSNTEEKEFSPMAFALRSNEPERGKIIKTELLSEVGQMEEEIDGILRIYKMGDLDRKYAVKEILGKLKDNYNHGRIM